MHFSVDPTRAPLSTVPADQATATDTKDDLIPVMEDRARWPVRPHESITGTTTESGCPTCWTASGFNCASRRIGIRNRQQIPAPEAMTESYPGTIMANVPVLVD